MRLASAIDLPLQTSTSPAVVAFIALAMTTPTRLGWLHEDNSLVRGGIVVYGFALTELQKAPSDQPSIFRDETVAACNLLVLYEVRKSSTSVLRVFIYIHTAF